MDTRLQSITPPLDILTKTKLIKKGGGVERGSARGGGTGGREGRGRGGGEDNSHQALKT